MPAQSASNSSDCPGGASVASVRRADQAPDYRTADAVAGPANDIGALRFAMAKTYSSAVF